MAQKALTAQKWKDKVPLKLEYLNKNESSEKAKTIQRLLEASKGDASIMADLVEAPDMKHYLYSDLTEHQQQQINKLWGI